MTSSRDFELLVHIGLPKAASTSLQQALLESGAPNYLGRSVYPVATYRHPALVQWLMQLVPFGHAARLDYAAGHRELGAYLASLELPGPELIVSDEHLAGLDFTRIGFAPRNTEFYRDAQLYGPRVSAAEMLHRLQALFGRVRVLVILRQQPAFLRSYYNHLISSGFNLTYQQFVEQSLNCQNTLGPVIHPSAWLEALAATGASLLCLPFEGLIRQDERVMQQLSDFFRLPIPRLPHANASRSTEAVWELFLQNLSQPRRDGLDTSISDFIACLQQVARLREQGPASLYALDSEVEIRLQATLQEQNALLRDRVDWDLNTFGYLPA